MNRREILNRTLGILAGGLLATGGLLLPGCGGGGASDGYSQEFEKPKEEPKIVTDPPTKFSDMSPREKRAQAKASNP